MRFDMTFDDPLRDGSSFGKIFTFTLYRLIFRKNNCGNTSTKGFLGLLNQVLVFVLFFSYSIKHFWDSVVVPQKPLKTELVEKSQCSLKKLH